MLCDAVADFSSLCNFVRSNMSVLQRDGRVFSGPVGPYGKTLLAYLNADACSEMKPSGNSNSNTNGNSTLNCCKKCCQQATNRDPKCV